MRLYPKKNHWLNIPGQKKVKVLSKNIGYDAVVWDVNGTTMIVMIINDLGFQQTFYNKSDFNKSDSMRNKKLSQIGI